MSINYKDIKSFNIFHKITPKFMDLLNKWVFCRLPFQFVIVSLRANATTDIIYFDQVWNSSKLESFFIWC